MIIAYYPFQFKFFHRHDMIQRHSPVFVDLGNIFHVDHRKSSDRFLFIKHITLYHTIFLMKIKSI